RGRDGVGDEDPLHVHTGLREHRLDRVVAVVHRRQDGDVCGHLYHLTTSAIRSQSSSGFQSSRSQPSPSAVICTGTSPGRIGRCSTPAFDPVTSSTNAASSLTVTGTPVPASTVASPQ